MEINYSRFQGHVSFQPVDMNVPLSGRGDNLKRRNQFSLARKKNRLLSKLYDTTILLSIYSNGPWFKSFDVVIWKMSIIRTLTLNSYTNAVSTNS